MPFEEESISDRRVTGWNASGKTADSGFIGGKGQKLPEEQAFLAGARYQLLLEAGWWWSSTVSNGYWVQLAFHFLQLMALSW